MVCASPKTFLHASQDAVVIYTNMYTIAKARQLVWEKCIMFFDSGWRHLVGLQQVIVLNCSLYAAVLFSYWHRENLPVA